MPYFFVSAFMLESQNSDYSDFWTMLLIQKDFWCQDWKGFFADHSLHILEKLFTVSLKRVFAGAKMNIPDDMDIKILFIHLLVHQLLILFNANRLGLN
jgi:hypothetical protein